MTIIYYNPTKKCIEKEKDLVTRAKAGDKEAFEILISKSHGYMKSAAKRILQNIEDVYDAMQDASLKAYKHIGIFNYSRSSFSTWVYKITLNCAREILGKERIKKKRLGNRISIDPLILEEDKYMDFEDKGLTPYDIVSGLEICDLIKREFENLTKNRRESIELKIEGRTYKEMAKATHKGVEAIRERVYNARISLKRKLRKICRAA
ncbi:sigma-70 family RNA polymerase sigma factor [Candidatus Woesearchaeota archaeon]|nr:sigma-70 family RNA polymerase sigma factor [Candidatus Woesearchaeota archaeon]